MAFKKDLIHQSMKNNRPLPTEKNKKVFELMKDELEGKIVVESEAHSPKTYSYLKVDGNSDKKAKGTKNV